MSCETLPALRPIPPPWNKGRIIGQKRPRLLKHVWSIRVRLEIVDNKHGLALFNMVVDSKLRGCDPVRLKVNDVSAAGRVKPLPARGRTLPVAGDAPLVRLGPRLPQRTDGR